MSPDGKILYFDVDGTILPRNASHPKPYLAGGRLEAAVREAGFSSLVCVGNYASIAHMAASIDPDYDSLGTLFRMLAPAFSDENWFRSMTSLIEDAGRRAEHIRFEGDWWYADDYAPEYLDMAGKSHLLTGDQAYRICVPSPNGDGGDVIDWIRSGAGADDGR